MRFRRKYTLRHQPVQHESQKPGIFTEASEWTQELMPGGIGHEGQNDKIISHKSLTVVMTISAILFVGLLLQLAQLQIVQGERLRGIAEGNRVRKHITYASRGHILDRNGNVLAENTASFQLSATPYLLSESSAERKDMYRQVADVVDGESPQSIARSIQEKGLDHPQPVLLRERIPRRAALRLEYILPKLRGFSLDSVPRREYTAKAGLAHIIGYVGRVSKEDLEHNSDILPTDFIGKAGIESQYDEKLRGQNGVIETEVDAQGRPIRTLRERPTQPGKDVRLTLDYGLQKRFAGAIRQQMQEAGVDKGSGVIMDPQTGEVLAMVSFPSYDNNVFSRGVDQKTYERLTNNPDQPMLNRAVAAGYPSGSVIKPIVLLGALDTNTVTEDTIIHDTGALTVASQYDPSVTFTYEGWDPSGLGPMDARRAIAMSSNIYFYTVAGGDNNFDGMGVSNLTKYMKMFGLGKETGIDLSSETAGRIPTPEWKQEQFDQAWFTGDTYNLAIGQGDLLVSPLQMTQAHAAIANGGELMRPHLSSDVQPKVMARPDISDHDYQVTREGMRMVTSGRGTTSPATFASVGVPVAGKSGTAETNPDVRDSHAWYSAFAPYDDPQLQGTVILEGGEGGSQYAAPALAEAYAWYFEHRSE